MSEVSEFKREALRELGRRLRGIRHEAGLQAADLVRLTGWSKTKCSRIESGSRLTTSAGDVRTYLRACGLEGQHEDLCDFVRDTEARFREWSKIERPGLVEAQRAILPLWESTRHYRAYASWVIPGPLQTREYTSVILDSLRVRRGLPDDVVLAATHREQVQKYLSDKGRCFDLLIEEAVLRRGFGNPEISIQQSMHLLKVMQLKTVQLGIIPLARDVRDRHLVWPAEDFWIFDEQRVKLELVSTAADLSTKYDLQQYDRVFSLLQGQAVYGPLAVQIVKRATEMFVNQWQEASNTT
ncbi:Scr1 family TA system antitoxin-like transcriptional regulator [Streptomyces sp. NPDC050085]|uniref:Scr1 family TA system antitoxin-like transcriptional regulator n=1 Tax=Streptomyces sp. NPDC050085 TaxID=3365600 RepID=UPI00379CAFDB